MKPVIEITDEVRALANSVDLEALAPQIAARDAACIAPLAALAAVTVEGLVLAFQFIGAALPHLPADVQKLMRLEIAKNPELAAIVMRAEAEG